WLMTSIPDIALCALDGPTALSPRPLPSLEAAVREQIRGVEVGDNVVEGVTAMAEEVREDRIRTVVGRSATEAGGVVAGARAVGPEALDAATSPFEHLPNELHRAILQYLHPATQLPHLRLLSRFFNVLLLNIRSDVYFALLNLDHHRRDIHRSQWRRVGPAYIQAWLLINGGVGLGMLRQLSPAGALKYNLEPMLARLTGPPGDPFDLCLCILATWDYGEHGGGRKSRWRFDPTKHGYLALLFAAHVGGPLASEVVGRYLTERGTPSIALNGALMSCVVNNHREIAGRLLDDMRVDLRLSKNLQVRLAAKLGRTEMMEMLLMKGRGVDPTVWNNEPLRVAAASGYVEIVRLLLESGKIEVESNFDETMLAAKAKGDEHIYALLKDFKIKCGIDIGDDEVEEIIMMTRISID
ncbi:hypothetical protein HK101_000788, partial [Irineochytrium annulatum]